jgi:hypothetical protein
MANIIVLKGGSQYSTLRVFSDDIANGFRLLGHRATVVDLLEPAFNRQLEAAVREGCDLAFGVNGYGCDLKTAKGVLWDTLGIPFVIALVDHPLVHMDRLVAVQNCLITCTDRTHVEFISEYFKGAKATGFLPLAGCRRNLPTKPFQERSIPLFFSGSYLEPDEIRKEWQGHGEISQVMDEIAEALLGDVDLTLLGATKRILSGRGIQPEHPAFDQLLRNSVFPDRWVRAVRRKKIIRGLATAGIEVHCYGSGWERSGLELECLHLSGVVDFFKSLDLMADAKAVLNILPNFPQGPHDRCFSAMLNGAVAASDSNRYLRAEFKDGSDILLFDWQEPESLAEALRELFADPLGWQAIADRGRGIAEARHMWTHRAETALGLVKGWLGKSL